MPTPPTVTLNAPTDEELRNRVRLLVGVLIVHCDPLTRNPETLATRMGISRQFLHKMLQRGRLSYPCAAKLQKDFGPLLAPRDELHWPRQRS